MNTNKPVVIFSPKIDTLIPENVGVVAKHEASSYTELFLCEKQENE